MTKKPEKPGSASIRVLKTRIKKKSGLKESSRRWLQRHGADEDETYDITVACQEACANAVEHAYAPGPAGFDVEAEHAGGEIRLTVRDRGHWRDARGTHRGRGLPIMEALMDTVDIQHSADGTAVQMRRALGARTPV